MRLLEFANTGIQKLYADYIFESFLIMRDLDLRLKKNTSNFEEKNLSEKII